MICHFSSRYIHVCLPGKSYQIPTYAINLIGFSSGQIWNQRVPDLGFAFQTEKIIQILPKSMIGLYLRGKIDPNHPNLGSNQKLETSPKINRNQSQIRPKSSPERLQQTPRLWCCQKRRPGHAGRLELVGQVREAIGQGDAALTKLGGKCLRPKSVLVGTLAPICFRTFEEDVMFNHLVQSTSPTRWSLFWCSNGYRESNAAAEMGKRKPPVNLCLQSFLGIS